MKIFLFSTSVFVLLTAALAMGFYDYTMDNIDGARVQLSQYKGKVVLVVNVASKCGLTPQYEDLQKLYNEKKDQGLVILGFPANNFAGQEPGSDDEIQSFCQKNYGVTFPMFSKISVKGKDIDPLYQFLTEKAKNGVLDSEVKWNFQKYLINKNGELVDMIEPRKSVYDEEVLAKIEQELRK
jgi:glutathione peroxidase